jgi:hypothetical protein
MRVEVLVSNDGEILDCIYADGTSAEKNEFNLYSALRFMLRAGEREAAGRCPKCNVRASEPISRKCPACALPVRLPEWKPDSLGDAY